MSARVFRAPGRVNLIGEHTDYNEGFVLPVALDLECRVTARPAADGLHARALDLGEERRWPLDGFERRGDWGDYVAGVAVELARLGIGPVAADLEITSTVPMGAGLSSSAALEVAVALALSTLAGKTLAPLELARLCQRAENNFTGVRCGLMDQLAAVFGRRGHALWIDCRSLDVRPVALPPGCELLVVNTGVRHQHASGEYNLRRQQCERAAALLGRPLRDASMNDAAALPEPQRRRARHVISENLRVSQFVQACAAGDLDSAGRLMYASHASLRDDYQVSCAELDFLVEAARPVPGMLGARLTGGASAVRLSTWCAPVVPTNSAVAFRAPSSIVSAACPRSTLAAPPAGPASSPCRSPESGRDGVGHLGILGMRLAQRTVFHWRGTSIICPEALR